MDKGHLALLAALAITLVLLIATYAELLGAEARGERLAGELSRARREIEELRGENRELREKVRGLEENLTALRRDVEGLRGRLREALRRAESLEELFSPRVVLLSDALNATVSVSVEGGYMVYNVSIASRLPQGTPVVLALTQAGESLERAWVQLYFTGSPGQPVFRVPRGEVTMLGTWLYVGVARPAPGQVFVAAPGEVKLGSLSVNVEGSGERKCVYVEFPAAYRGGGDKKLFYLLVAQVPPGGQSTRWSARLLMLSEKEIIVSSGGAICTTPETRIVLALLPVPLGP